MLCTTGEGASPHTTVTMLCTTGDSASPHTTVTMQCTTSNGAWQMFVQNKEGESASNNSDNPTLALTAMVSSSGGDDHRYSPPPTSNHGSPTGSTGKSPSIDGSGTSPVGRLEYIRSTFQGRGLSEDTVTILCASWRTNPTLAPGTNGQDGVNKFISIPCQHLW